MEVDADALFAGFAVFGVFVFAAGDEGLAVAVSVVTGD
jgi:hypothetical protein